MQKLKFFIFILNFIKFTVKNKMDTGKTELKKELEEYGFQNDHIDLATQISQNKEEVLNL
jgi:hypothetical protein